MPAARFFALLSSGRKIERMKRAQEHVASCDIASISLGDSEYYEHVRKIFYFRAIGEDDGASRRGLDPTDPATVAAVEALFEMAQRMN
ncbi:hypothetical protein EBZ39_08070 [bacterium]|nr:hypothetical protein [bacterium]